MRDTFILLIFLQVAFAQIYVNINNFEIQYEVTYESFCLSDKDRFQFLLEVSISQCIVECGKRRHCKALTYKGVMNICELYLNSNTDQQILGQCLLVKKDDIKGIQSVCAKECDYGQVCEMTASGLGECKIKECVSTTAPNNGLILGNERGVGKKIRYKCNNGYRKSPEDVETVAECLDTGYWSHTTECVKTMYTWTTWSAWGECSVTCDGGTRTRSRTCSKPTTIPSDVHCKYKQRNNSINEQQCNEDTCPTPTFLQPCNSDVECIENEGICIQNICFCKHTHYWNQATKNCSMCGSMTRTFLKIEGNCIIDNNLYKKSPVTVEDCKTICNEDNKCSSFEFWGNSCSFQQVSLQMVQRNISILSTFLECDIYFKECT